MCKPTCCSSNNNSGAGAAIAALVAIVLVCAIARPVIHAAEDILHIVLIIVSALAGLAFLALVTLSFIRFRAKRPTASFARRVRVHQVSQPASLDWQAREIEPGIRACDDPQRQIPAGMQPSYGMSAVLHRKIQAALEAGQEVIIIDGKSGTWP